MAINPSLVLLVLPAQKLCFYKYELLSTDAAHSKQHHTSAGHNSSAEYDNYV